MIDPWAGATQATQTLAALGNQIDQDRVSNRREQLLSQQMEAGALQLQEARRKIAARQAAEQAYNDALGQSTTTTTVTPPKPALANLAGPIPSALQPQGDFSLPQQQASPLVQAYNEGRISSTTTSVNPSLAAAQSYMKSGMPEEAARVMDLDAKVNDYMAQAAMGQGDPVKARQAKMMLDIGKEMIGTIAPLVKNPTTRRLAQQYIDFYKATYPNMPGIGQLKLDDFDVAGDGSGVIAVKDPQSGKLIGHYVMNPVDGTMKLVEAKEPAKGFDTIDLGNRVEIHPRDGSAPTVIAKGVSPNTVFKIENKTGTGDKPKLKAGERLNASGEVELIPGSDIYIKNSRLHGKDIAALKSVELSTKNAESKIDAIVNSPAFENLFGGYNAYVSQRLPGKTQDAKAKLDSLKSDLKKAGLDVMRSGGAIGQMTEREWPIVEQMVATLTPNMSEDEAKATLGKIKSYLMTLRDNASSTYEDTWSNTQFYKGGKSGGGKAKAADFWVK